MRSNSKQLKTPAWHWILHLPENRFLPRKLSHHVDRGMRQLLKWQTNIPLGFSHSGQLPYLECNGSTLRKQQRRFDMIRPFEAKEPKLWEHFAHQFNVRNAVRVHVRKDKTARYWLLLTDGSHPLAYAQRSINFSTKKVSHEYLVFARNLRSKRLGAQLLANALNVYTKMNLSEITLLAGLSAGSSVWPRLGFMPENADEWARLRKTIKSNLEELPSSVFQLFETTYNRSLHEAIKVILESYEPEAIFDVVDIDPAQRVGRESGLQYGIAGKLLAGGRWRGRLEINGVGGDRLRTYLRTNQIPI
jgi:hypothetical protein